MLIKGKNLTKQQRTMVLNAFIYRLTIENIAIAGKIYRHVEGKKITERRVTETDAQWLNKHAFHFVKDGSRLMENRKHAEPEFMAD